MELLGIGEFARRTRLSPGALRRYDESGLLPPARVDGASGYRWYAPAQVERARWVLLLRQIGVPLAEIKVILGLDAGAAAERVGAFWSVAEAEHAARRDLAGYFVDLLQGKRTVMYEVCVRELPARSLLSLHCQVRADSFDAVGKGFLRQLRGEGIPRPDGVAGAPFVVFHGNVDEDGDGPVEWCWPVLGDEADEFAAKVPELRLRTEEAHQEAFIHAETSDVSEARTTAFTESLADLGRPAASVDGRSHPAGSGASAAVCRRMRKLRLGCSSPLTRTAGEPEEVGGSALPRTAAITRFMGIRHVPCWCNADVERLSARSRCRGPFCVARLSHPRVAAGAGFQPGRDAIRTSSIAVSSFGVRRSGPTPPCPPS